MFFRALRCQASVTRLAACVLTALAAALTAAPASAQLPQTRIFSIFPAGGQAGQSVEVKITNGKDLDELKALQFNHAGITAALKMQDVRGKQKPVDNTFNVAIAGNVPPGRYELRAVGMFGVSNPRTFVVSNRPEALEKEPNNTIEQAAPIELNTIVNGEINGATDVDVFKFKGTKGQRVLATARADRIDSRLTAVVEVLDANFRRLGFSKEQVREDPLVDVTLPADGEYTVQIRDFTYQGGVEYFYRLTVGTQPHIDYIMPPAGPPGSTNTYTIYGRNLPGGQPAGVSLGGRPLEKIQKQIALPAEASTLETTMHLAPHEAAVDGVSFQLDSPAGRSNERLVHLSTAPVVLEKEPNDEPAQAQIVTPPVEIAGQFLQRGDVDLVQFDAKVQDVYFIEVFGQRISSPVDPVLVVERITKDDKGVEKTQRITLMDDVATMLAQNVFDTRTDDPVYRFQVPADGTYRVAVRDRYFEARGNPRLIYRLSIRREQPDFRVVAMPVYDVTANRGSEPGAIALRKGDNHTVDVFAFRQDGHDEVIEITAEGLPNGVTTKGAAIGPGDTTAPLIFTAAENAPDWNGAIKIVAKSRNKDLPKARALIAAQAAVKPAADQIPKLEPNVRKAEDVLKQRNQQLEQAKKALAAQPDNQGLKNNVANTQKQVDAATAEVKKQTDLLEAAKKKLADAHAAVKTTQAALDASYKDVTRAVRPATTMWASPLNVPAEARLSETVALSVMTEPAPFQILADVERVEANQGRQILVPVKLIKRNKFDNNVTLTFTGLPRNANIQLQNKPINKGKDSELYRLFVNTNAKVGTYTLYLKSQGQVSYSQNPAQVDRAKAEQAEVKTQLDAATKTNKDATDNLNKAKQQVPKDDAAAKQAVAAQQNVEKQLASAQNALKQAEAELAKLPKEAEAAAKQAAEKKVADAKAQTTKLTTDVETAKKANTAAAEALKKSQEAQKKAAEAAKAAAAALKQVQDVKKVVDKEVTDATNRAKAQNKNYTPPSTPIVITVREAPATLSASVPSGGNLKRGQKLDVKVTVRRINGFAGPVTLTLPLPPDVKGVTAAAVTIPADKNDGVIAIQAAGDATEGQLANMVVRAKMDHKGKAAVDAPINLKISK